MKIKIIEPLALQGAVYEPNAELEISDDLGAVLLKRGIAKEIKPAQTLKPATQAPAHKPSDEGAQKEDEQPKSEKTEGKQGGKTAKA